ncbi:MAG: cupin domain-containing protein [Acidimicrobiaceae bacterium]|nr:cupin domain-containing protein [Acidimicrobiaceae bacterium]
MEHRSPAGRSSPSQRRGQTFTGEVWADVLLPTTGDGVSVNGVFFTAGAHSFWHAHERGQLLLARHGLGVVCAEHQPVVLLTEGTVAWAPAGERHWHGALPSNSLLHVAVSLGSTEWMEEVSDDDYERACGEALQR